MKDALVLTVATMIVLIVAIAAVYFVFNRLMGQIHLDASNWL